MKDSVRSLGTFLHGPDRVRSQEDWVLGSIGF